MSPRHRASFVTPELRRGRSRSMASVTTTSPPARGALTDRTLIRAGAAFALVAGTLRLPASVIDPDTSGAASEALYSAIDVSLLFALVTAFVAVPSSRSRLGTGGFAIAAVGTGLLIGPEPTDATVDPYALGASAVTIGFAVLALAWRHDRTMSAPTQRAFLATLALGLASTLHDAGFIAAGIVFSLALLGLGRDLRRICASADRISRGGS
jgi:hypothetical protein